jgi:hypothetical protein
VRRCLLAMVCVGLSMLSGCAGEQRATSYPISGEVTVAGKPIQQGLITFRPADDPRDVEEGEIKDGKYAFSVSAGPKKVEFKAFEPNGPVFDGKPSLEQVLDAKYNTESKHTVTIEAEKDGKYDFKLD